MSDLIAAIATGSTATAIGIVRVSGTGCFAACDRVFRPRNGVPFAQQPSHKMVFGEMLDDSGAVIDQGLAVRFGGGHSYLSARKLVVSALVENLPDEIVVDVTELGVGKTIFVGDLEFENLKFITPATTAVCAVRVTRASRGAAEAAK